MSPLSLASLGNSEKQVATKKEVWKKKPKVGLS
jgi:hypothetical protein